MDVMAARRQILLNEPHIATATGAVATCVTDMRGLAKECVVQINPVQSGTGDPAPDNVRPISGWTGVTVNRTGANMIDPAQKTVSATVARWYQADGFLLRAGKTYTLTSDRSGTVYIINKATTAVISQGNNETSYTPTNDTLVYFQWYASSGPQSVVAMLTIDDTSPVFTPYTGTTIPVTFPAMGKNLFNANATDTDNGYVTGRYLTDHGDTSLSENYNASEYIPVQPNTIYTVSPLTGNLPALVFYSSNKTYISGEKYAQRSTISFTTPSGCAFIRISIPIANIDSLQLEKGSTATSYEPYTNTVYGGTLDVVSGVLVAEYGMVDMGTLNWTAKSASSYQGNYFQTASLSNLYKPPANDNTAVVNFITSVFVAAAWNASVMESIKAISGGTLVNIVTPSYGSMTAEQFKTAMSGVQLVYELATPITYQLTSQQITLLAGTNNVWATTGDTSVKYWKH